MEIISGGIYFVSNEFFKKVDDPFLKINYEFTKRPHYFAFKELKTSFYWLIPCSSKIEKFENIIKQKQLNHKQTDGIKIVTILNKKSVLLFQDMFPANEHYIEQEYIKGGQRVAIHDKKVIQELENNAVKIIKLLRRGIKFTPTAPNIKHIEKLMIDEIIKEIKNQKNEKSKDDDNDYTRIR